MALIISADEIKKELPNYSPEKAEEFHHESAQIADRLFADALKKGEYQNAILLSGGTASGKTEFMATQLNCDDCIIFDGTLATELGAKNKLRQILAHGKTPNIYGVIPDSLNRAFIAFLSRDRKFSDEHFYKTHSGSRRTLLWIANEYPSVKITVIESSYTKGQKIQFTELIFDTREDLITYLTGIQMTEADIIKTLTSKL